MCFFPYVYFYPENQPVQTIFLQNYLAWPAFFGGCATPATVLVNCSSLFLLT